MSDEIDDTGTIQALLERLINFRLPRTLAVKKRVDAGERLTDEDIAFLKNALEDAQRGQQVWARNPDMHKIGLQIVELYDDIVNKAVENEKKA
jgi:hypothetical protein